MITDNFEKIVWHLQKKRGSADISIEEHPDVLHPYRMLICDWNVYHLAVTFQANEYNVWLEDTQHVFARRQEIGTKFWDAKFLKSQEDVIDYIKRKMVAKK